MQLSFSKRLTLLKTAKLAFGTILEQADLHEGLIDAAEIEAIYDNTRQLLDGSAAIYDEVVCRCVEEPLRGYGCDSADNNCNQFVDGNCHLYLSF
jgi:hypothetical protein